MTPYYDADGITIYHARCEDVLPSIDPADVSLVLTDPPYGIDLDTDYAAAGRGKRDGSSTYERVAGDDAPFDPATLLRYRQCVLWGANYYADQLPPGGHWIVWDRLDGLWSTRGQGFNDAADAELAWSNLPGTVRTYRHRWNGHHRKTERGFHVHPTQKPVSLMAWIVDKWTKPGDLVLDPYMGSGPVARACADLGRRYIGIECVEDYCRVAVDRLRQGALDFGGAA